MEIGRAWRKFRFFEVVSGGLASGCVFYYGNHGKERKRTEPSRLTVRKMRPIIRVLAHSPIFGVKSEFVVAGRELQIGRAAA